MNDYGRTSRPVRPSRPIRPGGSLGSGRPAGQSGIRPSGAARSGIPAGDGRSLRPYGRGGSQIPVWLILIVILIALGAGAFLFFSSRKSDEQQAKELVEDFFEAVKAGDTSGAMECFSPAVRQQYEGALKLGGIVLSALKLPDITGLVGPAIGLSDYYAYQNSEFNVRDPVLKED